MLRFHHGDGKDGFGDKGNGNGCVMRIKYALF